MIRGVVDTHAALWYLFDDARLSIAAGDSLTSLRRQECKSLFPPSAWRKSFT